MQLFHPMPVHRKESDRSAGIDKSGHLADHSDTVLFGHDDPIRSQILLVAAVGKGRAHFVAAQLLESEAVEGWSGSEAVEGWSLVSILSPSTSTYRLCILQEIRVEQH